MGFAFSVYHPGTQLPAMGWTDYKLGVRRFDFSDTPGAGTSAQEVSNNFVRLADLVEAASDGSIDLIDYHRRDERDEPADIRPSTHSDGSTAPSFRR